MKGAQCLQQWDRVVKLTCRPILILLSIWIHVYSFYCLFGYMYTHVIIHLDTCILILLSISIHFYRYLGGGTVLCPFTNLKRIFNHLTNTLGNKFGDEKKYRACVTMILICGFLTLIIPLPLKQNSHV